MERDRRAMAWIMGTGSSSKWKEQSEMNAAQLFLVERRMRFMPCTVAPSDSVAHARALLEELRVNHLPVIFKERVVGIVTTRDLTVGALSRKRSKLAESLKMHPDRVKVKSVMTTEVRTVEPSDNLGHAMQLMQLAHIGALPVIEHGRLVGTISWSDLVGVLPDAKRQAHPLKTEKINDHKR
jgi:acetoin utilization protein AcuB